VGWRWRPEVTLPLAAAVLVYAAGWTRLALRSPRRRRGPLIARLALSLAGLVVIAIALLGLHEAAHERFLPHMVQHLLLMTLGVPALLLADPLPAALWALPAAPRRWVAARLAARAPARRAWRALTRLPVAWTLYALALWLWHLPAAYDAALAHGWLHDVEHVTFAGAAVVFWWPVIGPAPRVAPPPAPVARVVYLVLAAFSSTALGVLLAASPAPLYAYGPAAGGAGALEDQAWGGVLMWAVSAAVDMAAVLAVVARVVGGPRRRASANPVSLTG
jgi:putative membrane protein